ncbi:MAG: Crp/Fnr family transcriptional regulator [Chloroflexi bacterium]|nr:Crp/Fnr family transcriptional regulator [Chloroflexota bacterium]
MDANGLAQFAALQKLPAAVLCQLADQMDRRRFQTGESLFQQGGEVSPLVALQSGRVKLFRQSRQERVQILALPLPGECFGGETLANDTPCPYSATALQPARALVLPPEKLRQLVLAVPEFQEVFLNLVTTRLKQFVTLVHDLAFRDVTARLAAVLVARAQSEGQRTNHGIIIERLLSQQEYAEIAGTAREVVYRTFRKFEQEGLASFTRETIEITAFETLAEIARQETH